MPSDEAPQFAWAIHTRSGSAHGFFGRFWPFPDEAVHLSSEREVLRVRLFETRREARAHLKAERAQVYQPFPNAVVVRVRVDVKEVANAT